MIPILPYIYNLHDEIIPENLDIEELHLYLEPECMTYLQSKPIRPASPPSPFNNNDNDNHNNSSVDNSLPDIGTYEIICRSSQH